MSRLLFERHTVEENNKHLSDIQGNYLFPAEDIHHNKHIKDMK